MKKRISLFIVIFAFIFSLFMFTSNNKVKAEEGPSIFLDDVTTNDNEVRLDVYLKNSTKKLNAIFLTYSQVDDYFNDLSIDFENEFGFKMGCNLDDYLGVLEITFSQDGMTTVSIGDDGFVGTWIMKAPDDYTSFKCFRIHVCSSASSLFRFR